MRGRGQPPWLSLNQQPGSTPEDDHVNRRRSALAIRLILSYQSSATQSDSHAGSPPPTTRPFPPGIFSAPKQVKKGVLISVVKNQRYLEVIIATTRNQHEFNANIMPIYSIGSRVSAGIPTDSPVYSSNRTFFLSIPGVSERLTGRLPRSRRSPCWNGPL